VSKTIMTTAFAAMLAVSPAAFAETTTTTTTAPAMHTSVPENHIMPGQIRATQMDGATVYDTENRNIGDVKDIVFDRDGRIAAVVLDVGSFLGVGGKYVAVSMNDVKVTFDTNNSNKPRFTVNMTKEQLKSAQAYDLTADAKSSTGSSAPPSSTGAAPPSAPVR